MIKGNESDVGNIDFELQTKRGDKFLSFTLFLNLTLTLLHITKPHKNYLQNTQHVVLRNHPTLSIGTERLACLNNPRGVQLGTLA